MAVRSPVMRRVLIALNGCEGPKWLQCTAADTIFIGMVVEYEDADSVVYMPTTKAEVIAGISGCPSYHDSTAAFAAGVRIPVWLIGCGVEVWVTHDATGSVTVRHGDPITFSNTTEGFVELDSARDIDTIGTATRTYTCGAANTNIRIILN